MRCAYCGERVTKDNSMEVTSVRYAGSEDVIHDNSDDCPVLSAENRRRRWEE